MANVPVETKFPQNSQTGEVKLREWRVPADKVEGPADGNSVGGWGHCCVQTTACLVDDSL